MWRTILRTAGQWLLVFGPMLTMQWSLVDLLGLGEIEATTGNAVIPWAGLHGPKGQVELKLRLVFSCVALVVIMIVEVLDTYAPRKQVLAFRKIYLDARKPVWRAALGDGIRINVMHAKRRWFFLFLVRTFHWTWNDGFTPPAHRDAGLVLTEFQGVCGQALRSEKAKYVEMTPIDGLRLSRRERLKLCWKFRLCPWQLAKTGNIRAILSVPIFMERTFAGEAKAHKVMGVINIDAVTDEAAEVLRKRHRQLVELFIDEGKVLAILG